MKRIEKLTKCFWFSAICMFIMSSTILVMPLGVTNGEQNRIFTVVIGLLFWISAIVGYTLIAMACSTRKKINKQINKHMKGSSVKDKGLPGIIAFLSNKYAVIADTIMVLSLVFFVVINFTDMKTSYFAYLFLFLLIFSVHMHCMFNGKSFKMLQELKNNKRTRRESNHE